MKDAAKQPGRSGALRSWGALESPILTFDPNAEIERLRGEDTSQGGRDSKTLVKDSDFRIVLTLLKSNARLHEHKAAGRISVQAVAGRIRMHVQDKISPRDTCWRSSVRFLTTWKLWRTAHFC